MVDIHAHILAGLDDGAQTTEEALKMAAAAAKEGLQHIVASSHGNYYDYTLEEYHTAFDGLQQKLNDLRIPLKLYSGMEIFVDEAACRRLCGRELLTINNTKYILVEFDFGESTENVVKRLHALQKEGYMPVLAHPERYRFIQKEPELAFFLAEQEILLQLNLGSTVGQFGRQCRKTAELLMEEGLVTALGTDMHDAEIRGPRVSEPVRYLSRQYGERQVRLWLSENPSRILKGMPVVTGNKRH